jgi:LysR family transcriptional regulator, hydrogen peroxide-inducible genes activator
MTLNELRFVLAVAKTRNFRRAAEQCFISQPALSLAIQKLEVELGVSIFERGMSEVGLTAIGAQLVEQAQRTIEAAEQIRLLAAQGKNQLNTPLRVGMIYSVGPYLLPDLIPVLQKIAPQMPLEIEENITANLEQALRCGKLEVIVIALPFGDANIATRALYDEAFEVVVSHQHAWAKRRSIQPQELAEEKILRLDSGHCFSNQVSEICPELTRNTADIQSGTSLETIRNMVASGLGITVLPATANHKRYRTRLLSVIPFTQPAPSRRIALAWRKNFTRPEAIEALSHAIEHTPLAGITLCKRSE